MKPNEIKKHLDMVSIQIDQLAGLKHSLLMVHLFYGIRAFIEKKEVDSIFIFLSNLDGERKISSYYKEKQEVNLSLFQLLEIGNGTIRGQEIINFNETVSVFSTNFENFTFTNILTLEQFLHNHCPPYCLKIYLNYYLNHILPEKTNSSQVKI